MEYKTIKGCNLGNVPTIELNSMDELDRIQSDLRFSFTASNDYEEEGIIHFVIKDNLAYFLFPKGFNDVREESNEMLFNRKTEDIQKIKVFAEQVVNLPEWKRCKNKEQRNLVIENYMTATKNTEISWSEIPLVADYIKVYLEVYE